MRSFSNSAPNSDNHKLRGRGRRAEQISEFLRDAIANREDDYDVSLKQAKHGEPERQINSKETESYNPNYRMLHAQAPQQNATLIVFVPDNLLSNNRGNDEGFPEVSGSADVENSPDSVTGPHSGKGPKGYRRSADEKIWEHVCERLEDHGELDASEIIVDVDNQIVTISGTVTDYRQKQIAGRCCEAVQGVWDVRNRLFVLLHR